MKSRIQFCRNAFFILAFFLFSLHAVAQKTVLLQTGWKFMKGNPENAADPGLDDSKWQDVILPHDWAIFGPVMKNGDGNTGKLPWKDHAWYRRELNIPESSSGKTIYLLFDGVMSNPEVFINGKLAGKWDYGYNSFYVNITPFVAFGKKNTLAVYADNRDHDSRWYPGAGIYRKVQMISVDPVHIALWGVQITTPIVKSNFAEVRIMTRLLNYTGNTGERVRMIQVILNDKGNEVGRKDTLVKIPKAENLVEISIDMINPERWNLDNPNLYTAKTIIYRNDQISDSAFNHFGIRTMRFTADHGFYLNDKRIQFKGVCLHHDQGPLGSAFYTRAMERQLEIMKSMGCNAVRTSHNIPAPELLDLCDKMGILVFNEAFDKYDKKADINENTDFDEFALRNIRNFVERDRNHPCVFIWSVGNEMPDVQENSDNGIHKMQTMINYVRKFDPTRPVTMACDRLDKTSTRHFDFYDVHSWNYGRRYSLARQMEPDKSVIISESASTVSTRGFYELPLPEKKDVFTQSLQVSSYDLNAPYWAEIADDDFMWQQDEEYIAGEFVWTGFDYLGEPTPYVSFFMPSLGLPKEKESRSSYFGIVDLCGIPKDRFYLYKSYWSQDENTVHILPHWNWDGSEGKNIPVFTYTNGDCAELILNGKSLGKQCKNPNSASSVNRFRLMWKDVPYQEGELKAIAYKEGTIIGEQSLRTAGEPYKIKLSTDRKTLKANGSDLSYLIIEALDKNNNPCPLADNLIQINLSGVGQIAGVGNGNPQSEEEFQSNRIKLFYGKALLIVRSEFKKGDIKINVSSGNLINDSAVITVQ